MIEPSLQIGGGNWANKSDSLLGYHKDGANFYADELTFSRNSLGSYTDANGLVQSMPYNLFPYSNNFNNWASSTRVFKNSGQSGYDGSNNAWLIVPTNDNNSHVIGQSLDSGVGVRTISVYAKSGGYNYFSIRDDSSGSSYAKFDLNLGLTEISGTNAISSSIVVVNDGWYRCSLTFTETAIGNIVFYINNSYVNIASFVGDEVSGVYIQDAQLNQGSTALPYFATTTRFNLARVDYKDNVNGSLLLEPQRTNLALYSEQFDNAAWAKSGVDATANNTTSPDGTTNADKLANQLGTTGYLSQTISLSSSTIYTTSVFAKNAGVDNLFLYLSGSGGNANCTFNLTTLSTTPSAGVTAKIEDYGNGWYRCSATFTASSTGASGFRIYPSFTTGDGTSGVYIYGASLELGSYPTSYIKSEGAATTRLADSCSKTGLGLTNSTIFFEFTPTTTIAGLFDIYKTVGGRAYYVALNSISFLTFNSVSGGTIGVIGSALTIGENYKIAMALNSATSQLSVFLNGVKLGTYTTDITTLGGFYSMAGFGYVPQFKSQSIMVFPTNLSDTDAITLTTL